MALVRILVDGYSMLHAWRELAPDKPRHSESARDELIAALTRYHDATGVPITIFFDGQGAPAAAGKPVSTREVEVLYSRSGQTADDMIERTTHRLRPYGDVLVVTNDHAERDTVIGLGGTTSSCENFLFDMGSRFDEVKLDVKMHNRREANRYNRPR